METPAKHGFTFYLLTSYAPAVLAPLMLMTQSGHTVTGSPGMAVSFAVLYGALIGIADQELFEPARKRIDSSAAVLRHAATAFGVCALAGSGLFALIAAIAGA